MNLDLPSNKHLRPRLDIAGDICDPGTWKVAGTDIISTVYGDVYSEIEMSHVIEHLADPLQAMENLWWLAVEGGKLTIRCPHGSSDDAWEDPTHVRPIFETTFMYFGQGSYWRADYGYRGDWALDKVTLHTKGLDLSDPDRAYQHIQHGRNFVTEMVAELHAVKPARPPVKESQDGLNVVLV